MTSRHAGIVWNPSKTVKADLESAVAAASADVMVSWFETSEDDPGRAATQEALDAGVDVVIAAGGDGTVRAAAEHLADTHAQVDLGIIPLGTGNLLARNLSIPLNNLPAAFERALSGDARTIDIGWADVTLTGGIERFAFAVMAGFGIDAHMITETNDDLKDAAGWLAYVESLGRAVSASELIDIRLATDGGDASVDQAHTLIVGNCGTLQGGITLLPDADPADGELDLLVLHADGVAGLVDTMRTMVWDNGLMRAIKGGDDARAENSDSMTHRRFESRVVELDEPREFVVDGDDIGEATRVAISIQPSAVRIR
ncbi:MAG: diacylglycerol/lipid kinase family protein [Pseudoclavibacter sp.]